MATLEAGQPYDFKEPKASATGIMGTSTSVSSNPTYRINCQAHCYQRKAKYFGLNGSSNCYCPFESTTTASELHVDNWFDTKYAILTKSTTTNWVGANGGATDVSLMEHRCVDT